jgi:hypothetical protein
MPYIQDDRSGNSLAITNRGEAFVKLGATDLSLDAWGINKVSIPHSIFHGMWTYDIPASMWFMYENGTQVYTSTKVASVDGVAKIATTAQNDVSILESRVCPRYQPNRGHLFSTAGWFPNKTVNAVRDFGLFTANNGVFFRLKSDGKLYAVLRRNNVEVIEEEIDTTVLTGFDVEKNNIYDIQFQWRSAGNYNFYIGDPALGISKLVHQFDLLGTLTSASTYNPGSPVSFKTTQLGSTPVEMFIGCADVTSENGISPRLQYASAHDAPAVNGTNIPVLAIQAPLTISGLVNTRDIELARISTFADKKATFTVWITRDSAAFTGASWAAIDNSFILVDKSATALNTALCKMVTNIPTPANVVNSVNNPFSNRIDFPLVRGDYLVVTSTIASGNADCVIEWGEQV